MCRLILLLAMLYNPPAIASPLGVTAGGTGTATQFTAGSVVFAGTNGVYSQNNANFFWNNAGNGSLVLGHQTTILANQFIVDSSVVTGKFTSSVGGLNIETPANEYMYLDAGAYFFFRDQDNSDAKKVTIDSSKGNVALGADTDLPSGGTAGLFFTNGTAPSGLVAATSGLYADTVGSNTELFAINSASVAKQLTGVVASIDTTGLTANVGASTLYAVPASGSGLYRVCAYVVETTAGSLTSNLPNVQIVYTDVDSNISVTMDATPVLGVAGIGQTGALNANTVGTVDAGVVPINVKASTTIQYQTVNYASNAAGMTYALHIKLEVIS